MPQKVKEIMLPLDEYAVVDEYVTILDALQALDDAQTNLPADRQPHRAVLVRDSGGRIVGKLHHFAFLRALIPKREALVEQNVLDRAGVDDDLLQASMRTFDLLTGDCVNVCERARTVLVRHVYSSTKNGIDEEAALTDAIAAFLNQQTLSLLVLRSGEPVGVLRLSDLFDELAREMKREECNGEEKKAQA